MNTYYRTHTLSAILSASLMLALPWLSGSASAGTVSAPYVNDFSASVADFVPITAARWTHLPTLGVYSNEFKSATQTASVNVTNMGGPIATAKPFTYTTDFTYLNNIGGTGSYIGTAFLCGDDTLPAANGYVFYQTLATSGGATGIPLFLKRNNVTVASGTAFTQPRYSKGILLRFKVKGVYVDTDANGVNDALDITATIMNPATGGSSTLTYRDMNPLAGTHFGMKGYESNSWSAPIYWDSFSISNDTPKYTVVAIR